MALVIVRRRSVGEFDSMWRWKEAGKRDQGVAQSQGTAAPVAIAPPRLGILDPRPAHCVVRTQRAHKSYSSKNVRNY